MKPIHLALVLAAMLSAGAPAYADSSHADPKAKKVNGDAPDDLAPLAKGKSEPGPLENANFPPPGGATMGAGPNPVETGPVEAEKALKKP